MVKPGKEAATSGGRAKAAVSANAFSVPERERETLTQRIPLGNGGCLIKFPPNWHKKNEHGERKTTTGPHFRSGWHGMS